MHHGRISGVGGQGVGLDTQVAMEKAKALARAAAVRRRLLREAAEPGRGVDGDAAELMAAWGARSGSGGVREVSYWA